jgi:membrane carboxypeptidase/penicillin-binding protein PbpC
MLTGDIAGDRIRLNAGSNSATLHWYHNDRYLGRSKQMTPLYLQLTPGEHQVACMDDSGQTDTVTFTVLAG